MSMGHVNHNGSRYIYDYMFRRDDIEADCTGCNLEKARVVVPYRPPHPYRGTGNHRIVFILSEHGIDSKSGQPASKIVGYSWLITAWTKSFSEYCKQNNIRERIWAHELGVQSHRPVDRYEYR